MSVYLLNFQMNVQILEPKPKVNERKQNIFYFFMPERHVGKINCGLEI